MPDSIILDCALLLDHRRVNKFPILRSLANFDEMACRRERFWPMIRFTSWQNHHNEWPPKRKSNPVDVYNSLKKGSAQTSVIFDVYGNVKVR